jgi:hypothetical protein
MFYQSLSKQPKGIERSLVHVNRDGKSVWMVLHETYFVSKAIEFGKGRF